MSIKEQAFTQFLDKHLPEAKSLYLEARRMDPADAEIRFMLGLIDAQLGNSAEAETCWKEVARIQPNAATLALKLGAKLNDGGNAAAAEIAYRQSLRLKPDFAEAHAMLGSLLQQHGRLEEALQEFGTAGRLAPGDWESRLKQGHVLKDMGRHSEAESAYREALRLRPDMAEIHDGLGFALFSQQRYAEAVAAQHEAIRLQPEFARAHYYLGEALGRLGRLEEAYDAYCEVIRLKPDHVNSWLNRAFLMTELGSLDEALASYRQALSLDARCATAAVGEAWILEKRGEFTQAYTLLQPFLETEHPDVFAAVVFAALCRPLGRCDEAIALMERLLAQDGPILDNPKRATLHYELGRLYDKKNAFDAAFRHFAQGNELKGQSMPFNAPEHAQYIEALIQTYNSKFLSQAPRARDRSQRPVFIVGMPRSGTSLVEQILDSHPAVFGGGELLTMHAIVKDIPGLLGGQAAYPLCVANLSQAHVDQLAQRYLEHIKTLSPAAARVTDKMPTNFLHLGLINLLFPEAHVIHCMRDPLDTCLSCYFQNFGPWDSYTQDLRSLGMFYREYLRLMAHWKAVLDIPILDIQYEELVADQEVISRKMIAFCGLEWDENCLRFFESKRTVATASHDQVRQPVYQRSVGRWKNYEAYLGPLKESLASH